MEKFLHRGIVERVLHHGSIEDCVNPLLGIKDHNIFLRHGSMEKFLHSGSVEWVLYRGRMVEWKIVLIRCWVSSTIMIPRPW